MIFTSKGWIISGALFLIVLLFIIILVKIGYSNTKKIEILAYDVTNKGVHAKQDIFYKGIKIAYFSDLHLGATLKKDELREKIKFIAMQNADIYLFGGDLIGHKITKYYSLNDIKEAFLPLLGKPCYAVYGNHEFKEEVHNGNVEEKEKYLKAMGFIILNGETVEIKKDNYQFNLVGLKDALYFQNELTIKDEPTPTIVLIHEGDYFDELNGKYLMLSGHTHGGQIRFKHIPIFYKPKKGRKYLKGHYEGKEKDLIVSKGMGCNLFKMRFNAKCDMILLDYKKER